ncbi:MAG: flagellar motor switch protein FliN [Planctomycetaceae bacterium]|nr:flagellar motor switch protein FliN [Planctomycetaceae bacterium]MDP7274296.1 FliM/FliN family flagellar motor switch protein [Planctomycetaceae bacterium]
MSNPALSTHDIQDVELPVSIELGSAELAIEMADQLDAGSVVTLDRHADDPVDILVAGRLVARGELLVLDEQLAVRIVELLGHAQDKLTSP